jgi:hypothetical protein
MSSSRSPVSMRAQRSRISCSDMAGGTRSGRLQSGRSLLPVADAAVACVERAAPIRSLRMVGVPMVRTRWAHAAPQNAGISG